MTNIWITLFEHDTAYAEHILECSQDNYQQPIEQFDFIFKDINEQKWLSKNEKETLIENIKNKYVYSKQRELEILRLDKWFNENYLATESV